MAKGKDITKISDLIPDANNYNKGTEFGSGLIAKSIQKNGLGRSLLLDKNGKVIAGNKTLEGTVAAGFNDEDIIVVKTDGTKLVVVQRTDLDLDTRKGKEMALADNATAKANLAWDYEALGADFQSDELEAWGVFAEESNGGFGDNSLNSEAQEEQDDKEAIALTKLSDRFIAPPFSVLDTRQGYWIERKRYWKTVIGDDGESREQTLSKTEGSMLNAINSGVSILDPVLAECMTLWFGMKGGRAFDPFAGDTVFGYVSASKGMSFTGIELRKEQADLNNKRVDGMAAKYVCDDGQNVATHIEAGSQDLLFSCPPYFDLEVYSDSPLDASNQKEYTDFLEILDNAFTAAISRLKNNRFAVIVIGDIRDKKGFYRKLPDAIKEIFHKNRMQLYNEIILVESLGTLPQRAARGMNNRKVGKCHQNILVFYNGKAEEINKHFEQIKFEYDEGTDVEL